MPLKEPKFMQELHKIRAELTKEWKGKTAQQVVSSIRKEAAKSKYISLRTTSK